MEKRVIFGHVASQIGSDDTVSSRPWQKRVLIKAVAMHLTTESSVSANISKIPVVFAPVPVSCPDEAVVPDGNPSLGFRSHLDVGPLVPVRVVHADQLGLEERVAKPEGGRGELVQNRGVTVRVVTCKRPNRISRRVDILPDFGWLSCDLVLLAAM